ncbi:hypothetical protein Dsin_014989 [Dipteronia sinensis]|uniref:Endonuclease/exonuclease/phosphatase domain-containing protein n=1 Tax=Dipteronia sinensis TaxID=43782 RepID=A0AAE0EAK1_9ROSI|nr:hypothetical protein Dsin_014989 [Dipteronia sinensis]
MDNSIRIQAVAKSKQNITALVADQEKLWVFTIIDASPCITLKRTMWSYLDAIRRCFKLPWLIAGDFNEITCSAEKIGGRNKFSNSGFVNWIDRNEMVDIGFTSPKFTWITKMSIGEEIWERLDRALCSMEWRLCYMDGFVKHLLRVTFDHCLILIHLDSKHIPKIGTKPFRFEAMWLKHKQFDEMFHNYWNAHRFSISDNLQAFADKLSVWNREEFGNIFYNKRRLLGRIQGIQNCLSSRYVPHLAYIEEKFVKEYNEILEQEEVFWQQQSRNCWLKEGDRNTNFFHLSTMVRWRRNKLEGLKKEDGS